MMNYRGYAVMRIRSAAPERCLNRLTEQQIPFWEVVRIDSLTIQLCIFYRDKARFCDMVEQTQADAEVVKEFPGVWFFLLWLKRPVLLLTIAAALFITLKLPDYIWVITVSGNETVSDTEIVQALDELGIHFGTKTDSFQSQDIKNHLLNRVEGLQWAAVNCNGGNCQVLVKEREATPDILDWHQTMDVVAATDGTLLEVRVLDGFAHCAVGDTVTEGQLLVSGTMDWVVDLQKCHARAEIYALTWREMEAVTPDSCTEQETERWRVSARYLQIGRKRIKLSGSSRICATGCDKMITREILTFPGGYTFPVAWITEYSCETEVTDCTVSKEMAESILLDYGKRTVQAKMIAGEILSIDAETDGRKGRYTTAMCFSNREMIAREQTVNLFGSEQIYDGTDSERGAG